MVRASINWSSDEWDLNFIKESEVRTLIKVDNDYWVYKIEATGEVAMIFSSGNFIAHVYDSETLYSENRSNRRKAWSFSVLKMKPLSQGYTDSTGYLFDAPKRTHQEGVLRKATLSQVIGWLEGEIDAEVKSGSVIFKIE